MFFGILLIPIFFRGQAKKSFSNKYPDKFQSGLTWLNENKKEIDSLISFFGLNAEEVLSIGMPECARYNAIQNALENSANNYLYVSLGSKYGNFSVGRFQLKPSFAEQLEHEIQMCKELNKYLPFIKSNQSGVSKESRSDRLKRLESDNLQLIYLCAFYSLMEISYRNSKWESKEDKVEFYALAFNRGFLNTNQEILKWKKICYFPTGKVDSLNNFPYGTVALEFYQVLLKNKIYENN